MSTRRPSPWLVATVLAVAVTAVVFSLPFAVHWAWPSLDPDVVMLGNFMLGGLLGAGAVTGFLHWKREL